MPNFKNYIKSCLEAANNEDSFKNFKRNKDYIEILEHIDINTGNFLYDHLKRKNSNLISYDNLKKFCNKDILGNPLYLIDKDNLKISPTTLRYIKVLDDIETFFDRQEYNDVVEIGAGYGGQAKIFLDYYKLENYDCVDLAEVKNLIKKYLYDYKISVFDITNIPEKKWDLCISNYAFSECPIEIQELYFEKIIKNSKKGYFTMNFISHLFGVRSFTKNEFLKKLSDNNLIFKIYDEFPKSHKDNCVIIWEKNE